MEASQVAVKVLSPRKVMLPMAAVSEKHLQQEPLKIDVPGWMSDFDSPKNVRKAEGQGSQSCPTQALRRERRARTEGASLAAIAASHQERSEAAAAEEEDSPADAPDSSNAAGSRAPAYSQGSALHGSGECRPCAWFWKAKGCLNAERCLHCHLCPDGEIKSRRKNKLTMMRLGLATPKAEPLPVRPEDELGVGFAAHAPFGNEPDESTQCSGSGQGTGPSSEDDTAPGATNEESSTAAAVEEALRSQFAVEGAFDTPHAFAMDQFGFDAFAPMMFPMMDEAYVAAAAAAVASGCYGFEDAYAFAAAEDPSKIPLTLDSMVPAGFGDSESPDASPEGEPGLPGILRRPRRAKTMPVNWGVVESVIPEAEECEGGDEMNALSDAILQSSLLVEPPELNAGGLLLAPPGLQEDSTPMAASPPPGLQAPPGTPSHGSLQHGAGACRPCSWFWKAGGCQNGRDCLHCHLCPEGELKRRKKAKATMMRLGLMTPKAEAGVESDTRALGFGI
eukprot:TRINITY_DN9290_c0_g1_i1.p1 TRINITY_DN9290_c0_g1~~TRINITY_DN9290_c0_g1_i1.p1  ORF type:complete len:544 (-),score=96.33 TRINITY_DN9290_c0_g1_i1:107-1624(-)